MENKRSKIQTASYAYCYQIEEFADGPNINSSIKSREFTGIKEALKLFKLVLAF